VTAEATKRDVPDHRKCCPELYPPKDWQTTHPGESWSEWHRREKGGTYFNLLSHCCGWPMSNWQCINPECSAN
jgi:hypothetical protein